jgi:hypothetical protein
LRWRALFANTPRSEVVEMGLDWNPMGRPRPGHEEELGRLFREIGGATGKQRETLLTRFREISQPPFEWLGAPRVGSDPNADDWLKERLTRSGQLDKLEQARAAMRGFYVLDLLPECDGFPPYSNYGMSQGVDRFSFRAQFLNDVDDILGPELKQRAFTPMLADDLRQYAGQLYEKATTYARSEGVEHVEQIRRPTFEEGSPASRAHILFWAAKWGRFWAERGHGLEPWF